MISNKFGINLWVFLLEKERFTVKRKSEVKDGRTGERERGRDRKRERNRSNSEQREGDKLTRVREDRDKKDGNVRKKGNRQIKIEKEDRER
jgi:hypothetical protein